MREILFRGRKPNGVWLYGDLVQRPPIALIFPSEAPDSHDKYTVDMNTVGQFTGLTDKNGVKIFEGDILKTNDKNVICIKDFDDLLQFYYCHYECVYLSEYIEVIGNIHDNPELLK